MAAPCITDLTVTATSCAPTVTATATAKPNGLTLAGLLKIAPKATTCAGAPFPDECRTAEQALPYNLESFENYHITHPQVQAALVSLMAYETADFVYGINHYPGVLGQGTRNMQSPEYNVKYAESLGFGSHITGNLTMLMQTLTQDKYSFGSAAWFMTSQCPYSIRQQMWTGGESAWAEYLTSCVGISVTDDRKAIYDVAVDVLIQGIA